MNTMTESLEELFVNTYVTTQRRERLCFELTDPKRRYRGLSRFCHQAGELLDKKRIVQKGTMQEVRPVMEERLKKNRQTPCILFSPDPSLDQAVMTLSEGLGQAERCLDAVIVLSDDFAAVFTEAEKGGRTVYLLA